VAAATSAEDSPAEVSEAVLQAKASFAVLMWAQLMARLAARLSQVMRFGPLPGLLLVVLQMFEEFANLQAIADRFDMTLTAKVVQFVLLVAEADIPVALQGMME